MSKPKNQNRTFHLLRKADILTCYEHGYRRRLTVFCEENRLGEPLPLTVAAATREPR